MGNLTSPKFPEDEIPRNENLHPDGLILGGLENAATPSGLNTLTIRHSVARQFPADDNYHDWVLPDGRTVGDIVRENRSKLLRGMEIAQQNPESLDGGLGCTLGQYMGMAWPHGPIDFKNSFRGQADARSLGRAGNYAYYSLGSGILPDAMLDLGASSYNLYKSVTGQKKRDDKSDAFGLDFSARSVRDKGLSSR